MKETHKINEYIKATTVRLVGENVTNGIYNIHEALKIAEKQGLDLVEIALADDFPVCKIMDYAKFKYIQKRKQKEIKSNSHKPVIKEIRFGPNTSEHDFEFKLRHAIHFLQTGARVKAIVKFVGREIIFKERGELILLKFSQQLESYGKVDQLPKLEGKKMSITITP